MYPVWHGHVGAGPGVWPRRTGQWVSVAWPVSITAGFYCWECASSTADFSLFPAGLEERNGFPAKELGNLVIQI